MFGQSSSTGLAPAQQYVDPRGLTAGELFQLSRMIQRQETLSKESAATAVQSQRMLSETMARQQVDQEYRSIFQLSSPDPTAASQLETIKAIAVRLQEATTQLTIITRTDTETPSSDIQDMAQAALAAIQEGKNGLTILATALTRAHDLGHRFAVQSAAKVLAVQLDDHSHGYSAAFQAAWSKQEDELERRRSAARPRRRHRSDSPSSPPPKKRSPTPHQQAPRGRGRGRGRGASHYGQAPSAPPGVLGPPPAPAPT